MRKRYVTSGRVMGPLLVLVSPCFRENVITCKIVSFLSSLDNFLLENIFFPFLEIKFQNGVHLKKNAIFDLLFTCFSHQGKDTKIPSAHMPLTYIHVFCLPYWLFCFPNVLPSEFIMYGFSLVLILLIRAILEHSINNKMVSKI